MCPDGSELSFEIDVEDNTDETIQKAIKPFLFENYITLHLKNYSYDELILWYNGGKNVSIEELQKIVWKQDSPKYQCMRIRKICNACREGLANQIAHMSLGGCLYNADVF